MATAWKGLKGQSLLGVPVTSHGARRTTAHQARILKNNGFSTARASMESAPCAPYCAEGGRHYPLPFGSLWASNISGRAKPG